MVMRVVVEPFMRLARGDVLDRPGYWWDEPTRAARSLPLETVVAAGLAALDTASATPERRGPGRPRKHDLDRSSDDAERPITA